MRTNFLPILASLVLLGAVQFSPDSPIELATDLFPVEPGVNAERGFAVALDDNLLAVGAPLDDERGMNAGAVYLFRWDLISSWKQEAKLFGDPPPSTAEEPARFGSSVALRDGVLVVGALGEGAVYVFGQEDGKWTRQQRLTGLARHGPGAFGRAVAVDDNWLAVAAVHPHGRGVVYLYSGPQWALQTRLAPAQRLGERFGEAVALADGLLVVGAPGHGDGTESRAGAAYVFQLSSGAVREIAQLIATGRSAGAQLGAAVATDGTTVALGAPTADPEAGSNAGALYVSTCTARGCDPPQSVAAGARREDLFGFSVAVEGNLLAAGVRGSAAPGDPGGLRIFRGAGAAWTEEAVPLPHNAEERDLVGFAVALDGGRTVAAAVLGDQGSAAAGAVWSFSFVAAVGWREEAEAVARDPLLRPEDLQASSRYGVSVAATEQYLVVGALREPQDPSAGAVYVYRRAGLGWRQEARLTSPAGEDARDGFGTAVAVHGESLLVGAPIALEDDGDVSPPVAIQPRVYLFSRGSGRWEFELWIQPRPPVSGEAFGTAVAIEADILAVGAPRSGDEGVVVTLERVQGEWIQTGDLRGADGHPGDGFGGALALRQGTLAIGAPSENGGGAVYVAQRLEQGEWTAPARLADTPVLLSSDRLGAAVALGDRVLAIGAPGRREGDGAVLVFTAAGTTWTYRAQIALLEEHEREFGTSVALQGKRLLVGAPGEGNLPPDDLDHAFLFGGEGAQWTLIAAVDAINPPHGDRFGTAVALTTTFFAVTNPGPAGGDRATVFKLRRPAAVEATP